MRSSRKMHFFLKYSIYSGISKVRSKMNSRHSGVLKVTHWIRDRLELGPLFDTLTRRPNYNLFKTSPLKNRVHAPWSETGKLWRKGNPAFILRVAFFPPFFSFPFVTTGVDAEFGGMAEVDPIFTQKPFPELSYTRCHSGFRIRVEIDRIRPGLNRRP